MHEQKLVLKSPKKHIPGWLKKRALDFFYLKNLISLVQFKLSFKQV